MDQWINIHALWQILVAGLICGAGLPAAFAFGLRALPSFAKAAPTTAVPTTAVPPTAVPTTAVPTTAVPATAVPPTALPTTAVSTTAVPLGAAVEPAPVVAARAPVPGARMVARNAIGVAVAVVCFTLTVVAIAWGIYFIVSGG